MAGYNDHYFPQNDVFSYYQIFHFTYSSILLNHQIPLWEPYTSYGFPSAFDLAFTFGPTKALSAILGSLFRITDVKALYFGAVSLDFFLLALASACLARDLTGKEGAHVVFAAVAMPLTHYMETLPTSGYGFALTMVFVTLFTVRFLRKRRGMYLAGAVLTLIANIYGNPQYLVIPEVYLTLLFLFMTGMGYRTVFYNEWRQVLRSFFTPPAIVLSLMALALAGGLILIDRETMRTVEFSARMRDPRTLVPSLHSYLYYLSLPAGTRASDLLTGRTTANFDVWLYFGASSFVALLLTFAYGLRIRFVPGLLALVFVTTAFSLPDQFPLAKLAYYYLPGMKLYRPTSYVLVFAKPYAILAIACMLASPRLLEEGSRFALLILGVAVLLCAMSVQYRAIPVLYYFDSLKYGWIAIGGALLLCAAILSCRGNRWSQWAPLMLTIVFCGEIAAHRVAFEVHFYSKLAEIHPEDAVLGAVAVEPWYRWPRQLTYQPTRIPNPPIAAHFESFGSLYHGMWTFLGIDPCMPGSRSDGYVRWIAEGLKRHGATLADLETGQLKGLGDDFDAAYACGDPKLTFSDLGSVARLARFTPNELSIHLSATVGGTLIYRDAWTPYWKATLDGVTVPVNRSVDGFKTLNVPAGNHRVELDYQPPANQRVLATLAFILVSSLLAQIWLGYKGESGRMLLASCPDSH